MKKLLFFLIAPLFFVGCSKSDTEPDYIINETELVTNYDQEFQFSVKQGGDNVDASTLTWTSSDEVVGVIDDKGFFTAARIGVTTITGTNGKYTVKSKVTVESYDEVYREPILTFGSTKADIKLKEDRSLRTENETALLYNGENSRIEDLMYSFESNKLQSSIAILKITSSIADELGIYLAERYTYMGQGDDYIFLSNDNGVLIGVSIHETLGLNVMYLKETSLKAATLKSAIRKSNGSIESQIQSILR